MLGSLAFDVRLIAMAPASILHVGDDECFRIPVMEKAGLIVIPAECSVDAIRSALAQNRIFSVITFHNNSEPPADIVVSTTRTLSTAPLLLFENPSVRCNERLFDRVIPAQTSPSDWLKSLQEAIEESRNLREESEQLRQESLILRSECERLRIAFARDRKKFLESSVCGGRNDEKE